MKLKFHCIDCAFFKAIDDGDTGECRRYAPNPKVTRSDNQHYPAYWPNVLFDDWCGELQVTQESQDESE